MCGRENISVLFVQNVYRQKEQIDFQEPNNSFNRMPRNKSHKIASVKNKIYIEQLKVLKMEISELPKTTYGFLNWMKFEKGKTQFLIKS